MGDWGFPIDYKELSYLIKSYLDKAGRTTRWPENKPSPQFIPLFLERNPTISLRN